MILAGVVALCALGASTHAVMPSADAATRSTAVGIGEREFKISVYRKSVPPGEVRFNVQNFGEDAHNLVVLGRSGRPVATSPEIRAGKRHTLTAKLRRRGTYRLICTTADHTRRGMKAKLVVRKAKQKRRR